MKVSMLSHRETWAEVSLDAIYRNTQTFKSNLQASCRLMAVVKANGYGHGAVEVAQTALEAGADYLAVAFLDEALQLRNAGINASILILGYTPTAAVEIAIRNHVTLTVYSHDVLDAIVESAERLQTEAQVHIKVDTGMSRIGVTNGDDFLSLVKKAISSKFVMLEGMFTHLADADNDDPTYTRMQFERFQSFMELLDEQQLQVPIKHCCNTAATIQFPEMHLDMVRVGIGLYGLYPSVNVVRDEFPLQQAMQLKTRVSAVKSVPKGQPVSYGCTFQPQRKSVTATIPIGYADGLSRLLSNRGSALIHGIRVPIVGRVCMDQTILDVTEVEDVQVGDEVILFGSAEVGSFISIDELAALMGTINYEVVCLIGKRVPRVYTRNGEAVSERVG